MRVTHTIRLLSPLSHGDPGIAGGNVVRFRRLPSVAEDGELHAIPALSAGALRGVVRRLLWRETFDAAGLSRETPELVLLGAGAWDRLYAALANGGHIEKAEAKVDPARIRARRAALPVLSLLGSVLYSSYLSGRLQCSHAWLACREAAACGLVEDDGALLPARDLLSDYTSVRHVDREEQDPEVSHVTPMPTTVEVVVAGARLSGHAWVTGELEEAAWAHGLDLVRHLGGKSGQGHGEVEIQHGGDGTPYRSWLDAHREELRAALVALAEELRR